ncbi:MAG: hypothetical protein LQ350_005583 [Teloschistes chrysophthalmus]|nr:MAG: hypothetical protein LQ350_005583 [Niorma chrysophthalma]
MWGRSQQEGPRIEMTKARIPYTVCFSNVLSRPLNSSWIVSSSNTTSITTTNQTTMSQDIPEKQWAMVIEKTGGPVDYKQIPGTPPCPPSSPASSSNERPIVPKPGPDEVLVNIKYSGVCHTDLHAVNGDWPLPTKLPLVGGHEGAGIVVARGELVKDVEIGDHAGIKWLNGSCLSCSFCQAGDEPLCSQALLSGYTVDGTFQQYAIGKAAHVARIPKDVPLDAVAPVLCAGITVYKGLKESGAKPGQSVAIVGAGGGLGSLACQFAKAMGLRVIAIDSGEEKAKMVKELGAETFVDFSTSKNLVEDVQAATDDKTGPHAVLLVAVSEKPFQQATEYVRPRGTVVAIGLPANAYLRAPVFQTVIQMKTIKGSYVGNRLDTAEALEFFGRGAIKCPFRTVGMSELQGVYDQMKEGTIAGRVVVDTGK